jgi:hypothetical protein
LEQCQKKVCNPHINLNICANSKEKKQDWRSYKVPCKEGLPGPNVATSENFEKLWNHVEIAMRWLGDPKDVPAFDSLKITLPQCGILAVIGKYF